MAKTRRERASLIEAIYFLSTLKSFRTGKVPLTLLKWADEANVEARVDSGKRSGTVTLKIRLGHHERKTFINEKSVTTTNFAGLLRTVVFSPESLSAIKGRPRASAGACGSGVLFKLIPGALKNQRDFLKALRQRNALLKQMKEGEIISGKRATDPGRS